MNHAIRHAVAKMSRSLRIIAISTAFLCTVPSAAQAATPAFSVHKNGTAQTIAADTPTKLTWSTEVIDTNTNFATDRFTPTIPGNYLIVVSVQCAQPGACVPAIYKNGVLYAASRQTNQTFADQSPQVTAIVGMNGSTDYVEAFATSSGNSIVGAATQTYFSGSQIDGGGGGGGGGSSQWSDGTSGAIYYNSGNVGIGMTTPSSVVRLQVVNDTTDLIGTVYGAYAANTQRVTATGSYTSAGAFSQVYPIINSGITNSGWGMGHYAMALRNGAADIGSLASLYGTYIAFGHNNGTATARMTTNAYGVMVQPYAHNGTITNLYGLFLAIPPSGGTVTNSYGIYQADANATNYFAGPVIAEPPMMIAVDQKAANTGGGTCTAGSWFTRTLNTERVNTITGASLASNQITLPAGKYIVRSASPSYRVDRFASRLWNVTDGVEALTGDGVYSNYDNSRASVKSEIIGQISIAAPKVFRIEARCETTYSSTNALGLGSTIGSVEIHTTIEITKIQ